MAKRKTNRKKKAVRKRRWAPMRFLRRWLLRCGLLIGAIVLLWIGAYGVINPPTTYYIAAEERRLGQVERRWVDLEDVAPVMARAVVAAEDANFCRHWGIDMSAIRAAVADGARRGGSTISQQTVKNVFLWQGRNVVRKGLEGAMTPVVELIWTKRRILEVYLNMIEFDEGVFGIEAAAQHYFGVSAKDLTDRQAASIAVILPSPKRRSAAQLSVKLRRHAERIQGGAATIAADGRATCFED